MQYTSVCNETTGGKSLTATIAVNAGDWVLATVTTRSATTYPADWTLLHETTPLSADFSSQRMAFLCRKYTTDGTASITIQQSSSARIYINLIVFSKATAIRYTSGSEITKNEEAESVDTTRPNGKMLVWGCSANLWITSSPYGTWTCANIPDAVICLPNSSTQPRQANFIDTNQTEAARSFVPKASTGCIVDCVEVLTQFKTQGQALYEADFKGFTSLTASAITWSSELPTGTSLTVYAKLDNGAWQACANNQPLPCVSVGSAYPNSTLHIKVELSTADDQETPSIWNLRITAEDASDENYLLVNLGSGNAASIQNAIGAAHVIYDGTGGLAGSGGPVAAFDESFTPSGLVYKGHQNDAEHIELSSVSATGTLTRIYYRDYQSGSGEHLELSNITAVGVLTHIDDI